MNHFRILEAKNKEHKYFNVQYQKKLILGLHIWVNLNDVRYTKYDDALNEIKTVISPSDYEDVDFVYHYVDAYKIFKSKSLKTNQKKIN
jgi:hypothetical protein